MNIEDIINKKKGQNPETKYKKFGFSYNPFPKSGTANVNEGTNITYSLEPIDEDVTKKIINYVWDSLHSRDGTDDYKLIGTITGDYGTGKTQLLLFAKALIQRQEKKAYVIYINNPGTKLSELIGAVIENIGQEQFKKYLWLQIIEEIKSNENYKNRLLDYLPKGGLFPNEDPFLDRYEENHKLFIDSFLNQINDRKKVKEFNQTFKEIIITVIANKNDNDNVIANYFYDLVSEDFGINKTWETLVSGSGQYLDKKVVKLLNAIISIVEEQGFERFYLLVDEFEDITSGRLTKKEVDNYTHNLRTLIDKERRWSLLLAMTSQALADLKNISPPLVDRLTDREIKISRLTNDEAEIILKNYLNLARESKIEDATPFTKETMDYLNTGAKGLPRLFLRRAYILLERAVDELKEGDLITVEFAQKHLEE